MQNVTGYTALVNCTRDGLGTMSTERRCIVVRKTHTKPTVAPVKRTRKNAPVPAANSFGDRTLVKA
jgi:hypothetical protein